jgi:predicted MPP superfamily phosphohydrolase
MWRALSRAGIDVLENRAVRLPTAAGAFWVGGVGDLRFRVPDLQRTLADVPAHEPVLLLAHDPDVFPHVPARVSLTLSGHTHGGQVAIPLLRRPMLPSAYGEAYARGLVVEDGRHLLVSSGIGTSGLPIRLLAPPEVLVLTLRSASR